MSGVSGVSGVSDGLRCDVRDAPLQPSLQPLPPKRFGLAEKVGQNENFLLKGHEAPLFCCESCKVNIDDISKGVPPIYTS